MPFYYILVLVFKYETIFILIDLHQKNKWLNIYTKIKIITSCFMSYENIKKVNLNVFFLSKSRSREEVKKMIKDIVNDKFSHEKDYVNS